MESNTGTICLCGENIRRNKAPIFSKSNKKINISDTLSSHLGQHYEEWFLLEWPFIPNSWRWCLPLQWSFSSPWAASSASRLGSPSLYCTYRTTGKTTCFRTRPVMVWPSLLPPTFLRDTQNPSITEATPTYRVVVPLLWQHDIQRWLRILDVVELGGTWRADDSIGAQHNILCPLKGALHSEGKLFL